MKILTTSAFESFYLQRHSPGLEQVPWLGMQPSAQTGEEQKSPFQPSWQYNKITKKLQKSLFQKSLLKQLGGGVKHLHLAEALVGLLTGAVDTTQQSDAILRVIR